MDPGRHYHRSAKSATLAERAGSRFDFKVVRQADRISERRQCRGFGEFWVGSGRDVKSLVMFTLGTGIGGGIIVDDKILQGQHSHGAKLVT